MPEVSEEVVVTTTLSVWVVVIGTAKLVVSTDGGAYAVPVLESWACRSWGSRFASFSVGFASIPSLIAARTMRSKTFFCAFSEYDP